jgi:hypothetical protein
VGLAADTRRAIARSLRLPEPVDGDVPKVPGEGLVSIFARLAEIVAQRVNAAPEKNFIAFLDLVGVRLAPPQPARVPLTFHLAPGAGVPALLPARTLVAAVPAPDEEEPPTFETEREIVLSSVGIVAAWTRDPARDRLADHTSTVVGAEPGSFAAFEGAQPIAHDLYLGDEVLAIPAAKDISMWFRRALVELPWPFVVEWARWDGSGWQQLGATVTQDLAPGLSGRQRPLTDWPMEWKVTLPGVTGIEPSEVEGRTGSWLRARLRTSLPSPGPAPDAVGQTLAPDAAFAGPEPVDPDGPLAPFGDEVPRTSFAVACDRAFSKPRAQIVVELELDSDRPAEPSANLELVWEFSRGEGWSELGRSTPTDEGGPEPVYSFVDGTRALTQDGEVRFRAPVDWAETEVEGVRGRWLRVSVAVGDYGEPPGHRPPYVQHLAVRYTWQLPRIEAMRLSVAIARSGLAPDLGFLNEAPLDLSKDFLPFGEQPAFGDTFYVASDEALALPGANVTLAVTPTANREIVATPPTLAWEYWSAGTGFWRRLDAAVDDTAAFTKRTAGTIRLTVPGDLAQVEVNGESRRWIRARIVDGDYGRQPQYEPIDPKDLSKGYKLTAAPVRPPSLASVTFAFDYRSPAREPQTVLTVNDFRADEVSGSFLPYRPGRDVRPTLYVAADGDFAGQLTAIYFGVADAPYRSGAEQESLEPATVVWEYRNEQGWARLTVLDETRALTRRGLLTFLAPDDFAQSSEFGRTANWLRVRWERGGYQAPPRVGRVLTNTVWAAHAATVEDEVLGSGTGERNQVVRVTQVPLLPGQRIEVREADVPSAPELEAIEAEEGADAVRLVAPAGGGEPEMWVRWHEVVDFAASMPRSRHYVVDRLTGEIRFGDGLHGAAPPEGRGNIRAALYRAGGGAMGNRPVGVVTELKSAVPYVDAVVNVEPAAGGADAEPLEVARERGPRMLRHGDRAVAAVDLEDIAFEASPAVARVQSVPASSASEAGRVGLVIVPDSEEAQPVPSLELLTRVKDYVEARLSPTADLWVRGPGWLLVTVTTEVVPERLEAAAEVESAVRARLERFLHPLSGGPDGLGWPFGRAPYRSDLLALVESVPAVDHVQSLTVSETVVEPGPVPEAVLTYSGVHDVNAVAGGAG